MISLPWNAPDDDSPSSRTEVLNRNNILGLPAVLQSDGQACDVILAPPNFCEILALPVMFMSRFSHLWGPVGNDPGYLLS